MFFSRVQHLFLMPSRQHRPRWSRHHYQIITPIYSCPPINNDFLQAAIVNINLNHVPITVAASYCPPKHKITPSQFDSFFNSLGRYFIVGGDLNAKNQTWGCHSTNPKGHSLFQSITSNHLTILNPPNLTYWPTSTRKRPDILDIFVIKIPTNLNHLIKNLLDPSSDHTPVFLSLDQTKHVLRTILRIGLNFVK